MRYRYTGSDGKQRAAVADDAGKFAAALARQRWGSNGGVESLAMIGRSWRDNGFGGGGIVGKVWRAVIVKRPTAEQAYSGRGYVRESEVVRFLEGRVRPQDIPPPDFPFCAERQAVMDDMAAAADRAAAAARLWRAERKEKRRKHARLAVAAMA